MCRKLSPLFTLATAVAALLYLACKSNDVLPLADLPPAIKTYVEANFPGYALDEAEQETDCSGLLVYEVEIEQGEDELELAFDKNGNFLYSETEINPADLPVAIKNAIGSKYAGFGIREAYKLTMAEGSTRYEAELKNGGKIKEVIFDTEGTVICEQDE